MDMHIHPNTYIMIYLRPQVPSKIFTLLGLFTINTSTRIRRSYQNRCLAAPCETFLMYYGCGNVDVVKRCILYIMTSITKNTNISLMFNLPSAVSQNNEPLFVFATTRQSLYSDVHPLRWYLTGGSLSTSADAVCTQWRNNLNINPLNVK